MKFENEQYDGPYEVCGIDIDIEGESTTFDVTNESIIQFIHKLFDYNTFVGELKENSISTLDEKEFKRILEGSGKYQGIGSNIINGFGRFRVTHCKKI